MPNYVDKVLTEKKFISNIVILIGSNYFCVRQPDAGLTVAAPYDKMVGSLVLNQSAIDIKKVNTTIASYTFKLLDKNGIISALILGNASGLISQDVTIWLGRSRKKSTDPENDFSGYYQLPITRIKKIDHSDNSYTFSTSEDTERIARPIYAANSALSGDILSGTTTIVMRDAIDDFPATGFVRVEKEIFSYTSKDNGTKTFSGVVRGEFGTTALAHEQDVTCYESETLTDNPLNILLQILISNGGGGTYDVLKDGLGIDENLVDVSGIETIRDSLFTTTEVKLELSNIDSALKFIETEILQPFNLRFSYSTGAKLGLVVLDKAVFTPLIETINEDTITQYPKWSVDETKIINKLKISWDYDETTNKFLKYSEFIDTVSVSAYGLRNPLAFSFKGIKTALDGQAIIDDYARIVFARFATPVAEVEVRTQIDQSLKNIGDKVYLESSKIPSSTGGLDFASDMEVTSRSINYQQNEVSFKFAFTSFTKFRSGYIAPSDLITYISTQKLIGITNGRSAKYQVGFYMRLFNTVTQVYETDPPNRIVKIRTGENALLMEDGFSLLAEDGSPLVYDSLPNDLIEFEDNWATTLTTNHRIRFANYADVMANQKRFCFISDDGNDFSDTKPTYKVTY